MLNIFNFKNRQSKSSYTQKLAGFARYLALLSQGSDQNFNKVAIRLYIRAITSLHYGYTNILTHFIVIYAQNLSVDHSKIVKFHTYVYQQKRRVENLYILPIVLGGLLTIYLMPLESILPEKLKFLIFILPVTIPIVLGYIHLIYTLKKIEKNLYRNLIPTPKAQLNLEYLNQYSGYKCAPRAEYKFHFILKNVPPYTVNKQHIDAIVKLSYSFGDKPYQVSSDYHLIAPYHLSTFKTPEEVDRLLDYLGMSVKNSPHNYN